MIGIMKKHPIQSRLNKACSNERDEYFTMRTLQLKAIKLKAYISGVLAHSYEYDKDRFRFAMLDYKKVQNKIFKLKNNKK